MLTAPFLTMKYATPHLKKNGFGRIINIASINGLIGFAGKAAYNSAKHGVIGLTKTTAKELASRNILVNAIAPGFITTEMTDALPEDVKNAMLAQIPLAKLGQPTHIAKAVAFLASEDASYITGQTLHIDGGLVM